MEEQEVISIRKCPRHGIDCVLFCTQCGKLVCDDCKECSTHELVLALDMLDTVRRNFCHISLAEYIKQSQNALEDYNKKKLDIEKDLEHMTKERDEIIEKIKTSRENKKKDLELISKTMKFLDDIQEEYISDILKLKCNESKDLFDVNRILEREINEYSKKLIKLNSLVELYHYKLNKISINAERLKIIANIKGDNFENMYNDDDILLSITLLKNKGIFEEKSNINTSIDKFNAFTGANLLREIETVMKQGTTEVEKGVHMSKPVPFRRINVAGMKLFPTLSHEGIFSCYCDDTKTITFINLCDDDKISVIPVENKTIVGFYDNKAIFLTTEMFVRECEVCRLFDNPTRDILTMVEGTCEVNYWTDVSLLNSTRALIYRSTDNMAYEYNVDTRENIKLYNNKIIQSIANLTGINMNVKAIFDERVKGVKNFTCVANKDNSSSVVFEHDAMCYVLIAVIPSSTEPTNLVKAMKVYNHLIPEEGGGFNINTKAKIDTITSNKSTEYQTLVRLYRDVFIIYDSSCSQWNLVRIYVD